jgi:hypothetical protein
MPEAFQSAPEGLREVVKIEFRTEPAETSANPLKLDTVASTDLVLFDLASIEPADIDFKKVAKDCDLFKEAALNHPEKLRQIISAFQPGRPPEDVLKAAKIAEEVGLTEPLAAQAGGGFIPLIVIGVALLCVGCMGHCEGAGGHVEVHHPTPPPPVVDAGPG